MSSLTITLVLVAQKILIYGGLSMIVIGMFGSLMIILIFTRPPLSQNPCSIYLVVNGILSFLLLPLYYLPNIVTFGFQINWLALNTPFCKFQMSCGAFTVTSIFVINCFISFDRYAMSSRSVNTRAFSSKRVARMLITIGLILVWCLIGTPVAVLFENVPSGLNGTNTCTSRSTGLLLFAALIYYPILEGLLPIVLTLFFWHLNRKHIHTLTNQVFVRRFDKQISRMYLFQILANLLASFPFAAINLYRAVTTYTIKTIDQVNLIEFIRLLAIYFFYIQYCSDFYIYIFVSNEIRQQAKRILCIQRRRRNNRIATVPIRTLSGQRLIRSNSMLF